MVPCHHVVMRSRPASPLVSLGASLVMVASLAACDGQDPGGGEERTAESTAATSTPTVPPTPSEELGLAEGWGPAPAELDRAARIVGRMRLPDLAGQVIVARLAGNGRPGADGPRPAPRRGPRLQRQRGLGASRSAAVNRALSGPGRAGRTWPVLLGVDQEGGGSSGRGEHRRPGFPTFMSTGAAGDPDLTRRRTPPGAASCAGSASPSTSPRTPTSRRPVDPAIGARGPARRRTRSSPSTSSRPCTGFTHGRRRAGRQALPGPRFGDQPTATSGSRCSAGRGRSWTASTWCRSARGIDGRRSRR